MTATTKETTRQTKAPSHIIWFAPDRENAPWTRIGAQWPVKDGTGFKLALDMVPIGKGSIVACRSSRKATLAKATWGRARERLPFAHGGSCHDDHI